MISVVAPIFNESENLPEFYRRTNATLQSLNQSFEIIFVDDGSCDDSPRLLREMHQSDPCVKIITLSRNFGHQPAVTAGIHLCTGDAVVLIDGDLQDAPEIIADLLTAWQAGAEVVVAQRRSRQERGVRRLGMRLFYPLMRWISDLPGGPDAGIFGLLDRRVIDAFNQLPERNRFIPGLRSWLGFRQTIVLYDRKPRAAGKPKQSLRRLTNYALDAMFSFSYKPLRAATYLGFGVSVIAFALACFYLVTFFAFHKPITGFTTTITSVLFLGGVQLICTGILGEYMGRIYEEVKQRPLYVVSQTLGWESQSPQQSRAVSARSGAARPGSVSEP